MGKIFLFVALFVAVGCTYYRPALRSFGQVIKQVKCTVEAESLYIGEVHKASCDLPRKKFVELMPPTRYETVTPRAIWVERCIGSCERDSNPNDPCFPVIANKSIHTHIWNVRTGKQYCATYNIEWHTHCSCLNIEKKK